MTRRAGVDVGTNSLRLLVADHDGTHLHRDFEIVRLGRAVDRTGALDDDRLAHAMRVLERFRDGWRERGVQDEHVRLAATSAVRDARDRERFLDGVADLAPDVDVAVLSGEDEAVHAFRGVAAGLQDLPRPLLVVDVGGGSTELAVGDLDDRVLAATSLQLGSVRVTERFLTEDPPGEAQVLAAMAEVRARVDDGLAALGPATREVATLVGVAGTVTTVAALAAGAGAWQDGRLHGVRLLAEQVVHWSHELLVADSATIRGYPEVAEGRVDVIAGGALVVRGVVDALRVDHLVVSESDGLDALVLP